MLIPISANAAPNLIEVQGRVRDLQEQATTAAEGAQEAKVTLAKLNKTLVTVQQEASQQGASVTAMNKAIGAIAADQYKSGPLSKSLELLFSSDPSLYLSTAGSLEAITRKKSADLKKFSVATQRLNATSLTVADKLSLVKAAEAKFKKQLEIANSKLDQAEALLAKLTAAERARLAKLNDDEENADQQRSLADAGKYGSLSGRGGTAIKYALAQIGDRYMATCEIGFPKNTKSPACKSFLAIALPYLYWALEECGSETPAAPNARMVNPEQSQVASPSAPKMYLSPI